MGSISSDFIYGYGLKDEVLDSIAREQNLKDITQEFSASISNILDKFSAEARIKVFQFDESSEAFRSFAFKGTFFHSLLSNKKCCVILKSKQFDRGKTIVQNYILAHEYAHHYQITSGGFPYLLPTGAKHTELLTYVDVHTFGPKSGTVLVDSKSVTLGDPRESLKTMLSDFGERVSDCICDWLLLRERNLLQGFREFWMEGRGYMPFTVYHPATSRYTRRLMLFDEADTKALLETVYPHDKHLGKILKKDRKKVLKLNRSFPKAAEAFDKIFETQKSTDFHRLRDPVEMVNQIKRYLSVLNIYIRTPEEW